MPGTEVAADRRRSKQRITLEVPLNRVEGDLEIRVALEGGAVADAWSSGTLYRGIENLLKKRGALDGLVITPRICGICGTAHLTAAARALESIAGVSPPPDAVRIRNLALMTEHIQSDVRHAFLMFMVDFAGRAYAGSPFHDEAVRRYEPFRGTAVIEAIRRTKEVLEIVALLGGQWPHSSYMVPGGVASTVGEAEIGSCRFLLRSYRRWYEERVLGCPIERWLAVDSREALEKWLAECPSHRESELGFFLRLGRHHGLDRIGAGPANFLSYGCLPVPDGSEVCAAGRLLTPSGFARGDVVEPFDQRRIEEHVAYSWYEDYEGGRHPFSGETRPYATGEESRKYSWAKAPRYDGAPAETGPLAEMIVAGHPLYTDWVRREGASVLVREVARLARPARLIPAMETWLSELTGSGPFYEAPEAIPDGEGIGLVEASRGALGHWVRIEKGRIAHYQVITPTAWNGSPRDSAGRRGPWEEALVGVAVADPELPVELGHVVRSFDACLVCTVHTAGPGARPGRMTL